MRFTISWHIVSSTVSTTKWSHCPASDLITTMLYTFKPQMRKKIYKRKAQIYKTGNKSILGVTRKDVTLFCSDGFIGLCSVTQYRLNQYCINSFEYRKHWPTHTDTAILLILGDHTPWFWQDDVICVFLCKFLTGCYWHAPLWSSFSVECGMGKTLNHNTCTSCPEKKFEALMQTKQEWSWPSGWVHILLNITKCGLRIVF